MSPLFIIITTGTVVVVLFLMRTRQFYIVRHGETLLNAEHIKQGEDGGLSESGKQQAEAVGVRLSQLDIQKIIASPYERARETASIINSHLRVPISYSQLLVERRNPSEIIGKKRDNPEVVKIVDQMDLAYHEDEYRFSDEENFIDLKTRARKCLNLLARQGARETCVVTHHVFLKMLLAYMLYRERLHAGDYTKLSFFNMSDNGGISVCEYNPWKIFSNTRGWKVLSFNETI
ncbi:MAG: histidine phosphatase family protein [bacterium]